MASFSTLQAYSKAHKKKTRPAKKTLEKEEQWGGPSLPDTKTYYDVSTVKHSWEQTQIQEGIYCTEPESVLNQRGRGLVSYWCWDHWIAL